MKKNFIYNVLKTMFMRTQRKNTSNSVANWINNILNDKVIPENIAAFCFNLYEESDGSWAMELVGTESFDLENEDWACDEVTDFGSREHLYNWKMECKWDEALSYMVNELNQYLSNGKYAKILKSKDGVGVGFVDGNIEILHCK